MSGKTEHPEKTEEAPAPQKKSPVWKAWVESFKDLARGLFSPDRPTRRMSAFFFLSFFGTFFVLIFGTIQLYRIRKSHQKENEAVLAARRLQEILKRQEADAEHKASQISLGTFMIELRPAVEVKSPRSLMNLAEIEMFADCDSKETREYIEANLVQARGNVAALFAGMDRRELLSKEGKRRLKRMVLERLNLWLPKGSSVREIFITKLILN